MSKTKAKVLLAVGGTGGHMLPAQAFSKELETVGNVDIRFAGAGLATNPYFQRDKYPYKDISSSTPFGKQKPHALLFALLKLAKGYFQSLYYLVKERPDLIIGFGSFHSFPILVAAYTLRIPYALYESNAVPGKVIRALSKKSSFVAIQMPFARKYLKGTILEVQMPLWLNTFQKPLSSESAKELYHLDPKKLTLLVFGGSQGASLINHVFKEMASLLANKLDFQIIHILGKKDSKEEFEAHYESLKIPCYVSSFESNMASAWTAADLAICRSGASSIAEIIDFATPSILIPYPYATDAHQRFNAAYLKEKKAAIMIEEKELSPEHLADAVQKVVLYEKEKMIAVLEDLKEKRKKTLTSVVHEFLEKKGGA